VAAAGAGCCAKLSAGDKDQKAKHRDARERRMKIASADFDAALLERKFVEQPLIET
jgi:hypothetical protein